MWEGGGGDMKNFFQALVQILKFSKSFFNFLKIKKKPTVLDFLSYRFFFYAFPDVFYSIL